MAESPESSESSLEGRDVDSDIELPTTQHSDRAGIVTRYHKARQGIRRILNRTETDDPTPEPDPQRREIPRREILGKLGLVGAAVLAGGSVDLLLAGDEVAKPKLPPGVKLHYPYPHNPETPILPGRPVAILVDSKELALSGKTFTLKSADAGDTSKTLTPQMREHGYRLNGYFDDISYEEATHVSSEELRPLRDTIAPINALRADQPEVEIYFFPLDQKLIDVGLVTSGNPGREELPFTSVEIYLKPDAQIPIEHVEATAFHERLHIVRDNFEFPETYKKIWETLTDDASDIVNAYKQKMGRKLPSNSAKKLEDGDVVNDIPEVKALGPLANVVTDSSYINGEDHSGHPLSDMDELWVSTLVTAHFYPRSLMATIERLDRSKDRELMKTLVRDSIQLLRGYADNPRKADQLFDPEIIAYVRQ